MDDRTRRRRIEDLQARAEARADRGPRGTLPPDPVYLGQVFNGGAMPTTAGRYFLTHPYYVAGTPTEGGAGTNHADATRKVPVFVLPGGRVPAVGDVVACKSVPIGRWVVDGGGIPCGKWLWIVRGCASADLAGATIVLKQSGVTIATGTTADGTGGTTLGHYTFDVPLGTYDITVAGPAGAGFATITGTVTFTCTHGGDTTQIETLGPNALNVCAGCCNFPIPKTLYTADDTGAITLTWTAISGWNGSSISHQQAWKPDPFVEPIPCSTDGLTVKVNYQLLCQGGVNWTLSASWGTYPCSFGDERYEKDGFGGHNCPLTSASCSPLSLVFSGPVVGGGELPCPNGTGPLTVIP